MGLGSKLGNYTRFHFCYVWEVETCPRKSTARERADLAAVESDGIATDVSPQHVDIFYILKFHQRVCTIFAIRKRKILGACWWCGG